MTPIQIGVIINNTGPVQKFDQHHQKALHLAIDRMNKSGGINQRLIKLVPFYSNSTSLGARSAAIQASKSNVVAVIGPPWSSHALAAAKVLQKSKIPMISPMASNPDVTKVGDYIFRATFTDTFQAEVLASFAIQDLQVKKAIVLVTPDNIYSTHLGQTFSMNFIKSGGTILQSIDYVHGVTNYQQLAKQLKKLNAELIFLPGYPKASASIINESRNIGVKSIFLGADGWNAIMLTYSKQKLENSYFTSSWHPDINTSNSHQFVRDYQAVYGPIASRGVALYYDTIQLLFLAIQQSDPVSPDHIKNALSDSIQYTGVTGNFNFDKNGDSKKPIVILKFTNGIEQYIKQIFQHN